MSNISHPDSLADARWSSGRVAPAIQGITTYKGNDRLLYGAAFGVAISAAVFTALSGDRSSADWLDGVLTFQGRQDNLAIREAAIVALAFNLLMVVVAMASILLTVPKKTGASA